MTRRHLLLAVGALYALASPAGLAAQAELTHVSSIDLSGEFNSQTQFGSNPLSVAFDGTSAYIGGYNNSGATADVGVVKVSNIFGGAAAFSPLANSVFSSPNARGLDAVAYDPLTGSLLMGHDSGSAATSFISRNSAADGSSVWSVSSPQGGRPTAMAVDPTGDGGSPGVAFLVQGSGRRRLLNMATGATVFDGSNGGIINSNPTFFGTGWRGVAFDSEGNVAISEDTGFQYGVRTTDNQWQTLGGALNATSSSLAKDVAVNNVGQGIAILEDLGSDLLAVSGRNMTQFTDVSGGVSAVSDTQVHIRNLDGSTTGLTQIVLSGDEDGIGSPWTGDIKNLAFGLNADGNPTLLVVDFTERRLDVYVVPEPGMLAALAMAGMVLVRPRRRGC